MTQYPEAARAAAHAPGGVGCADACHGWLPEEQVAGPPFAPPDVLDTTAVPGRPAALLAGADTAHAGIWRDGFVAAGPRADLRMLLLPPGCGGCHGAATDRHGAIPTCLDCHDFGGREGALHGDHVAWVMGGQATNDPGAADRSPCLYCHDFDEPDAAPESVDDAFRAACYNCHLSGHQPLDAAGHAHFWALSD